MARLKQASFTRSESWAEGGRPTAAAIVGTDADETLDGGRGVDRIRGGDGDDLIRGFAGDDVLRGGAGFDALFGGFGDDLVVGGGGGDLLFGGAGDDVLFGDRDSGIGLGDDLSADRLSGGRGDDRLIQGEGNDVMSGGAGDDDFVFRFVDPQVALAAMTGRAFTAITDFRAADDRLVFDAAGVGTDAEDAAFVDGGAGSGGAGGRAATFFSGAAAGAAGEAVVVATDVGFATGVDAVNAVGGEAAGDLIVYFNTTVGVASLLYVDGENLAHSIARFTGIESLADLQAAGLTASDFVFA